MPGAKVTLTFSGRSVAEAESLWTSFPAEVQRVTNENEAFASFEVACPPDLEPGVQFVQLVSPKGISNYQLILVDSTSMGGHKDEHHSLEKAQPVQVPSAVDCILREEQVDYYSFEATAGDRIPIEVVAHRMGSQMDPVIRILDEEQRELAWIDDGEGGTRDSQFLFHVPLTARYFLAVHDIGYGGGNEYDYRLRLGAALLPGFPFARPEACESLVKGTEQELGELPARVEALLSGANHQEFTFRATKDQRLVFKTKTRSIGSPCDLLLRIVKEDGSLVAESDPSKPGEAELSCSFTEDGSYRVQVREITGLPPECRYHLFVEEFRPRFELTIEDNRFQTAPGKPVKLKVTADRQEYKGPIELQVRDLPAGFSVENHTIPADKNEVEVQVTAAGSAQPGTALHFRLAGRTVGADIEFSAPVSTRPALRKAFPLLLHFPAELDGLIALGIRGE